MTQVEIEKHAYKRQNRQADTNGAGQYKFYNRGSMSHVLVFLLDVPD